MVPPCIEHFRCGGIPQSFHLGINGVGLVEHVDLDSAIKEPVLREHFFVVVAFNIKVVDYVDSFAI